MTPWQFAVGIVSAVLVLAGTVVTARYSARTGGQANRTADWEGFTRRLEADNERLRERMDLLEASVDTFRRELRARDDRINDLSDELDDFRDYSQVLRDELQRRDPSLVLPVPPARIARHFSH